MGNHYGAPHNIDLDLLTAGIVLHDIGKVHELSYERGFQLRFPEGQALRSYRDLQSG